MERFSGNIDDTIFQRNGFNVQNSSDGHVFKGKIYLGIKQCFTISGVHIVKLKMKTIVASILVLAVCASHVNSIQNSKWTSFKVKNNYCNLRA